MFNLSRDQARLFFFDTWKKYREHESLTELEKLALEIIILHPECHSVLADPERYLDRDYLPEMGDVNPVLHMGMHLAIEEQLSTDQPRGVRSLYGRILRKTGDRHKTCHAVMECLAEMICQAHGANTASDETTYLECLEKHSA